jgi:hypothetical protein
VQLTLTPYSAVTPYGEATAGVARLGHPQRPSFARAERADGTCALAGRTMPIAGLGGGLQVCGGPRLLDIGYRYQGLFASDLFRATLGLGQPLRSNEVRFGVGVRF